MVGRLIGYLTVVTGPRAEHQRAGRGAARQRTAIANAVNTLETLEFVRRSRAAGERMDRVRIDMTSPNAMGFDVSEYQEQADLAREGLALLADEPPERKALLLEGVAVRRVPGGADAGLGAGVESTPRGAACRW